MSLAAFARRLATAEARGCAVDLRVARAYDGLDRAARVAREVATLVQRDRLTVTPRRRAVLVVDDESDVRDATVTQLAARLPDVAVRGVESAIAAQCELTTTPYAVVVLDYHLGAGETGIAYTRRLARGPRPVIVTGHTAGDALDTLRAVAKGLDVEVFTRPLDAREWDAFAAYVAGQVDDATG